jgi:hypothetical protein
MDQKKKINKLTKKEIVDKWNNYFGNKIFESCGLCEKKNSINAIFTNLLELKQTKTLVFVCSTCKNNAGPGWVKKHTSPTVDKIRLSVWLNVNFFRRNAKCFCCHQENMDILSSSWHLGHCTAKTNGGKKTIFNLKPICVACNFDMADSEMMKYKERYSVNVNQEEKEQVDEESLKHSLRMFHMF